jgi:hypothetical protein
MQPHRIKKFSEFNVGDAVWDGGHYLGTVDALVEHEKRPQGYVLVVNGEREYSIYKCLTKGHCPLTLTRNVPSYVMVLFSDVIKCDLSEDEVESKSKSKSKPNSKKYPVLVLPETTTVEQTEEVELEQIEDVELEQTEEFEQVSEKLTKQEDNSFAQAPYLDFV